MGNKINGKTNGECKFFIFDTLSNHQSIFLKRNQNQNQYFILLLSHLNCKMLKTMEQYTYFLTLLVNCQMRIYIFASLTPQKKIHSQNFLSMSHTNNDAGFLSNSGITDSPSMESYQCDANQHRQFSLQLYQPSLIQPQQNTSLVRSSSEVRHLSNQHSFNSTVDSMDHPTQPRLTLNQRQRNAQMVNKINQIQRNVNERADQLREEFTKETKEIREQFDRKLNMIDQKFNSKLNNFVAEFEKQLSELKTIILDSDEQYEMELQSKKQSNEQSGNNSQSSSKISQIMKELFPCGQENLKYERVGFLGKGSYGQVELVFQKNSKVQFALKQFKKSAIFGNKKLGPKIINEVGILNEIESQYVIQLVKTFSYGPSSQNGQVLYCMVLQFGGKQNLRDCQNLSLIQKKQIMKQIIQGIRYVHELKIVHMDLKPENILIRLIPSIKIKLCDFGQSVKLQGRSKLEQVSYRGSYPYMSPEMINGLACDLKTDMWSLGVVIYELLFNQLPFSLNPQSSLETCRKNINQKTLEFPENDGQITRIFGPIIKKLLVKEPKQRLCAYKLMQEIQSVNLNKIVHLNIRKPNKMGISPNKMIKKE